MKIKKSTADIIVALINASVVLIPATYKFILALMR